MKIDKNRSTSEFKQDLIEKYDVKSVNASGHLATALTTFQYISLFIPDGLSPEQEENIIYSYLNGIGNHQKVKENLNQIQEEFVMNCQIAIINNSPNLFKASSISTKVGINMSILALGTLGSSMGDHKINEHYTVNHLQEDLFFLYFKMYRIPATNYKTCFLGFWRCSWSGGYEVENNLNLKIWLPQLHIRLMYITKDNS